MGTCSHFDCCSAIPKSRWIEDKKVSSPMVKSLLALAMFLLLGTSVVALAGFPPKAPSGEAAVMAKGDRLKIGAARSNCSPQIWPAFAASCLRDADSGGTILEARLVTARR